MKRESKETVPRARISLLFLTSHFTLLTSNKERG